MMSDNFWKYFFELFETLPRQGPGTRESTERALGFLPALTSEQRILDIGCGVGAQTLYLAQACPAQILATDNHPAFLETLRQNAEEDGLSSRIEIEVADMGELPYEDASFEVLWAEGSSFIIGFSQALKRWKRLIKPGGHLVISEYCWLRDNPPEALIKTHLDGCQDVGKPEDRREAIAAAGYELLGDFVLPPEGWWENFYAPMGESLKRFRKLHAGNAEALAVAEQCQQEIELYKQYKDFFGYVFFIMRS